MYQGASQALAARTALSGRMMTIKCHRAVVRDVRRPGHMGTRGGTCTDVAGAASQVSSQAGGRCRQYSLMTAIYIDRQRRFDLKRLELLEPDEEPRRREQI